MNWESSPFIKICNEDDTYYTFLKYFDQTLISQIKGMRCKKALAPISATSKISRYRLHYEPHEGLYEFTYEGQPFAIRIDRGEPKLTTDYRQIEYLKELTVYGPNLAAIQKFMNSIYELSNL